MDEKSFDFKKVGLPEDFDLIWFATQTQDQYSRGFEASKSLRNQFEEEDQKFHDQSANREKINDYSFFALHSAFMARTYSDRPKISWQNIGTGIASLVTKNLNNAWNIDMNTPEMARIQYQIEYDKYKYGAGTLVRTGWDGYNKKPIYEVADPMLIINDPDGDYVMDTYKFIGFESQKFPEEFPTHWQNTEDLPLEQTTLTLRANQLKVNAWVNNPYQLDRVVIYSTFSYWKGSLYYSVWGRNRTELLYIEKYEPELEEEKANGLVQINKFIHTTRWRAKRDAYFGHRVAIFALNVQDARSLIATLRFQMEKSVLYPMYIANTRLIQDRTDLDFGFNKVIFANPMEWESLDNAMRPIAKDRSVSNPSQVDRELAEQLGNVTGGMSGNMVQGQETSRRETLGAIQTQQSNADINLSLVTKVGTWFEEYLAWGWYRAYLENFAAGDKKIVELKTGLGSKYIELKKKDLIVNVYINVKVESYFEILKQNKETSLQLSQLLAETANLNMPESAKMAIMRDAARAKGIDENKVDIYLHNSPQEEKQLQENLLLAENKFVPISPEDDDLAHIFQLKLYAIDNEAAAVHQMSHVEAYIAKGGQGSAVQQADENAASLQQSMAGQMMANQVASSNWQQWQTR